MRIKRFVALGLVLCLFLSIFPAHVNATEVTSGTLDGRRSTLAWEFADGILTITGDDYCVDEKTIPWEHLRDQIKSIVFDGSLTILGNQFSGFPNLTSITWPADVTYVYAAFKNCFSLERVDIPDTVYRIESSFVNCISLTQVDLPSGLRELAGSFGGCKRLTNIDLPNQLEYIASSFIESGLTGIVIPASVKRLIANPSPFRNCLDLETIVFLGDPPTLEYDKPFEGVEATVYYRSGNTKWTASVRANLGSSATLTWVGVSAPSSIELEQHPKEKTWLYQDNTLTIFDFSDRYSWEPARNEIKEVVILDGVTAIPDDAFYAHYSLVAVTIPNTVTSIGEFAFSSCESLLRITIPASVTEMQRSVFESCYGLKEIYFKGDAPTIDTAGNGFLRAVTATVYYPAGNATWTEEVMQQYGGTITWVPYEILNGWVQTDGLWYYYVENVKQTGWLKSGNYWYYLNADGVMQTGWVAVGGKWYYMNKNGVMLTGWVKDNGKWYYMASGGAMQRGWITVDDSRYYLDSKGVMKTGWIQLDGTWYYLTSSGKMATGWTHDGSYWYYMDENGMMQRGWITVNGKWYYLNKSGVMQTGWLKDGNYWYYLDATGAMVTGTQVINGKTYVFNKSGVWIG